MNIEWLKKRKLLVFLVFIVFISFILGCLFISILSDSNQELVKSTITSYFNSIKLGEFTYLKSLYKILSSDIILCLFMWLIGISIVGVLAVVVLLMYESFMLGFSFVGIIYTYGFKGILLSLVYMIPDIINLIIFFILSYYSISFSVLLFNYLFKKKEFNRKIIMYRYVKMLFIFIGFIIFSSFISIFIIPNICKFLTFI